MQRARQLCPKCGTPFTRVSATGFCYGCVAQHFAAYDATPRSVSDATDTFARRTASFFGTIHAWTELLHAGPAILSRRCDYAECSRCHSPQNRRVLKAVLDLPDDLWQLLAYEFACNDAG